MSNYPWASNFLAYAFPCCDCGLCYYDLSSFTSESEAQTFITDKVHSCVVVIDDSATPYAQVVTVTGSLISISSYYTQGSGGTAAATFQIYVPAACTISTTFSYTGESGSVLVTDLTTASTISDTAGDYDLPTAGKYQIEIAITWAAAGPGGEGSDGLMDFDITAATCDVTYCIFRGLWDDGGGNTGTVTCE